MLNSRQRAQLRALANSIDTILHVGKGGISENVVSQCDSALEARELIKGRVLENSLMSAREAAEELARMCRADVVCTIGSRFVLYRESQNLPREKRIRLVD
jgi:RNA-binding protein